MNYFTFVKNNWAKLGLANYKTGVSSTKMKEAFKKSKGAKADTSEKQLSNKFSTADNKHFKRGVKMVKEAIEQDTNKEQYKNMDDMWNKLINNKPDMPTKKEADNSLKAREAVMASRAQQIKDYTNKLKKEAEIRKKRAFIPFDIDKYDLPKLKKAIILFMTDVKDAPAGATAKVTNKTKLLKASSTSVYELMQRMNIQESDIADYYKGLVKTPRKKIPNKEKAGMALIKTADNKLTIRSFKGKTGIGILKDAIYDYYKSKRKGKINLSSSKINQLQELITQQEIPLKDLKNFYNKHVNRINENERRILEPCKTIQTKKSIYKKKKGCILD